MKIKLNPILLEKPHEIYKTSINKARFLRVVSIINLLAICTFASLLLATLSSTSASMMTIHITFGIAIPFFGLFYSIIHTKSKRHFKNANFYKNVIDEIQVLSSKNILSLKYAFIKNKCRISGAKKAIPALAHLNALKKTQKLYLEEIENIKKIKPVNRQMSLDLQKNIHNIYEREILKNKLKAAEIYNIINHPTDLRKLNYFGKIFFYSFAERMASILEKNDTFFVFKKKTEKERNISGISYSKVDRLEIKKLSNLIFNH